VSWYELPVLSVDTETTGVNPFADRIVELAFVVVNPDGTTEPGESLIVDPGIEIPETASAIHGITTDRVRAEGIGIADAIFELTEAIGLGHPLVIYNARFDWPLILTEAARAGIDMPCIPAILDPYVIDKGVDKYRKGKRTLEVTAAHYGVALSAEDAHGGLADATASGRIMFALAREHEEVRSRTATQLVLRQVRWAEEQRASFAEYKRRTDPGFVSHPGWPIPSGTG
jgi:DNA polymerase-3 subunit epsilon